MIAKYIKYQNIIEYRHWLLLICHQNHQNINIPLSFQAIWLDGRVSSLSSSARGVGLHWVSMSWWQAKFFQTRDLKHHNYIHYYTLPCIIKHQIRCPIFAGKHEFIDYQWILGSLRCRRTRIHAKDCQSVSKASLRTLFASTIPAKHSSTSPSLSRQAGRLLLQVNSSLPEGRAIKI